MFREVVKFPELKKLNQPIRYSFCDFQGVIKLVAETRRKVSYISKPTLSQYILVSKTWKKEAQGWKHIPQDVQDNNKFKLAMLENKLCNTQPS